MDGPRMLSGSELVNKGATKRIDGQLPVLGTKEVSPSGSWLERKQIQSALEARKHLIEVDRIEKIGSLSHAVWRDDQKLAEVTKKTGSYWQYIGHNIGKHLYLLPEEALFLIEINCLLLKHNEVTVSLQKAYSLCLDDKISIEQYKVYATLSRLGYRVFRHKEPTANDKNNVRNVPKKNEIVSDVTEKYPQTSQTVPIKEQTSDENIASDIDDSNNDIYKDETSDDERKRKKHMVDVKMESSVSISNEVADDVIKKETLINHSDEKDSLATLIDAENIKVETIENHADSEIIENDINNSIEKTLKSSQQRIDLGQDFKGAGDEIPFVHMPAYNQNVTTNYVNINNEILTENYKNMSEYQVPNMLPFNKEESNDIIESDESNLTVNENITTVKQKIYLSTQEVVTNLNKNNCILTENITPAVNDITENNGNINSRIAIINGTEKTEISNTVFPAIVYSVDESGLIRVFREDTPMETNIAESNAENVANNSNTARTTDPDPSTDDSVKHYDEEMNYYNVKMQKLIERKSSAGQRRNLEALHAIQDFYQEQVVSVNVPDEEYLPRNIFLHKTAYVINVDIVRSQNASNANISSDEMDLSESLNRASRGTDAPSLTDLPRFVPGASVNNAPPKYPTYRPYYRPPSHWYPRVNYNAFYNYNMLRPPTLGFFALPRYRYQPQASIPQRYSMDGPNASNNNQAHGFHRQCATLKSFHLKAIRHIALRFKNGVGRPAQVQALNNLLATYNSRYGDHLELSQEFDIIDRKEEAAREVIILDDEPKCKKARLNNTEEFNSNLDKLKELAKKLKDLHAKNLAVSRHRRVFSNAIKTFNKSFNAELYLDSNFEIKDRKLIVLDSSSDSDAVLTVKEKDKSRKRKKLRNPYNILKHGLRNVNVGASTSREVPILQTLSLNAINDASGGCRNFENDKNAASPVPENNGEDLLKYFHKAWLSNDDDFGRVELCSLKNASLDALLFKSEYLYDILKESPEFECWIDLKLAVLKEIQGRLDIQKQQAEALSNDFLMETESQIKPILESNCTDLRSALKMLAIIRTNKEIPNETSLRIHFDVCNRDVHFKKSNPPKPNFRVVCCDESATFPSSNDVVALQAKYDDAVPTVFAFIGTSSSISYLQINSVDLPVFIPDDDLT